MDGHRGRRGFRTFRSAVLAVGLLVGLAATGLAAGDDEDPTARGTQLLAEGKPDEALAAFDRAVDLDGRNAEAHAGRCTALYGLRRPTEALPAIERALEIRPERGLFHAQRALVLDELRREADAVSAMEKARRLDPRNATIEKWWGGMLLARGQVDQALQAYDRAIEFEPEFLMAHWGRAGVLFQQRRFAEAAEAFGRVAALAPQQATVHLQHGIALSYAGQPAKAIEALDRALELGAPAAQVHFYRACVLIRLARAEKALEACDRAGEGLPPGSMAAQLSLLRAQALVGLGRCEEALKALGTAPTEGPVTIQVKVTLLQALVALERFDEAKSECDWCLLVFPDNPAFPVLQSQVLARCDGSPAALTKFAAALTTFRGDHTILRHHADLLLASGRPEEALAAVEESLRLLPECHGCAHLKALCLESLGRVDDARKWLAPWLERAPECADCRTGLARALMLLGHFEAAEKTLAAGDLPEDSLDYARLLIWRVQGKFEEALKVAERCYGRDEEGYAGTLVRCLRAAGKNDRAREIAARHSKEEPLPDERLDWAYLRAVAGDREGAERALAAWDRPWTMGAARFRARIHGVLGQTDQVIVWGTKAVDLGYRLPSNAAPEPDFAKASKDRRWKALERKMRSEVGKD